VASPGEILAAFDDFDWSSQLSGAARAKRDSPTFSVTDVDRDRVFWLAGYGSGETLGFVCSYNYLSTKPILFGFLRRKVYLGLSTRSLSFAEAREAIQNFVYDEDAEFEALIAEVPDSEVLGSEPKG
jgi:hypothetical protein